jgi:predicted membrane channel-forming protein YqfA (hemolysin III family)
MQIDQDAEHLRLLKIGFYILAAICGLGSLAGLIFLGMGGFFASGVIPGIDGSSGNTKMLGGLFLMTGFVVLALGVVFTFLTWRVGQNLAEYRNRTFCIVIAALWCLHFPLGTIVGVCAIIVLCRPSVQALFDRSPDGTVKY